MLVAVGDARVDGCARTLIGLRPPLVLSVAIVAVESLGSRAELELLLRVFDAVLSVVGLTRAAALDYAAQNVRIGAVCPGYIDTPMIAHYSGGTAEGHAKVISEEPIGRMGRPEEIAPTVVWMCSDAAAFMIGHALVVDGGQTIT